MNASDISEESYKALVSVNVAFLIVGLYTFVCACLKIIQDLFFNEGRQQSGRQSIGSAQISQQAGQSNRPGTEIEVNAAEQQGEKHSDIKKSL